MNNLILEPRVNKHGATVNRWVKNGSDSPAAALASLPPTLPASKDYKASMGAEMLAEYSWIQVSDGIQISPLERFADPEVARGSCWRMTSELIESVDFGEYGFDCTPTFANAQGNAHKDRINIEHYAVFLDSDSTVVDFTIRQFDADLPFPLITSFDEWSEIMRTHLGPNVGLSVGELEDDDYDDEEDEYGEY